MGYAEFLKLLPSVSGPQKKMDLRAKLKWTALILILYFLMSEVVAWGVDQSAIQQFAFLEIVLGSRMGSLVTLGIGPIVTASIILQLLVGSKIVNWDTSTEEGKLMFMGSQKVLGVLFSIFEAIAFVLFGAVPPASAAPFVVAAVIIQLAFGGIIVILMDEVVSKWGIGSGISLFIAAGVSKSMIIQAVGSPSLGPGLIPSAFSSFIAQDPLNGISALVPIIFTFVVFFFVVFAQAVRVEVPLAFGQIRGFGTRWPLKFFYTSNIPVILVAALLANVRLWGNMLANRGVTIFGTFDGAGTPISGMLYYITPPAGTTFSDIIIATATGTSVPSSAFPWITYALFLIAGSVLFSVFWVNTSGMDSKSVARQIQGAGLSIPGFRRDPRIIERVLDRYIPYLAILGGATVGLLAAVADFTGALGTGTGILLTVMIIHNLYEDVASKHMEEMHPALRKFMG